MIPSIAQRIKKRLILAAISVPFAVLAMFTLNSDAQEKVKEAVEKGKEPEKKVEEAKEPPPTATGLYREFSGVIQLGNYDDRPQKKDPKRYTLDVNGESGIESMAEYFKAQEAPHVMGGTVYFAVFRNVGRGANDTFGTGMPGGLDQNFVPGDGIVRPGSGRRVYASPRLDTSAKYLFLFQVVASRGLDARNQLSDVQYDLIKNAIKAVLGADENNKIKLAVGEDKAKLLKNQKDSVKFLADSVNRAMLPDDSIEDIHRFSVQLNVDPRHITSWGYFDKAGFAVNIVGQKEYVDRWGHRHKTVADGGVVPNDLVEDRTQAISFLPRVTELVKDPEFDRVKKAAYAMGVVEGSFHVDDANVGIEKSLPYRFAKGLADRGAEIKFASYLGGDKKKGIPTKPDFAVKPHQVRIIVGDERFNEQFPEFEDDDDYTTSALVVDFDQKGIKQRGDDGEIRGIPRTKHSMVFGFTTNLEPNWNRRVRLDDLDSTDRNKDLPFEEFFATKVANKVPAREAFSRGYDYWKTGKKIAGFLSNRDFAFASRLGRFGDTDSPDPLGFVLQPGGGGAAAGGAGASAMSMSGLGVSAPPTSGSAGITGGLSSGLGGGTGGGGGGSPGFPGFGSGGGVSRGGGFGGGGGLGNGGGSSNGTQDQTGTQSGTQGINIVNTNTLINQQQQAQDQSQAQQQQQQQQQNQNQNQRNRNNHGHHDHHGHHGGSCNGGHVVPAPASLLLGLLGLPGLLLLRRRKPDDALIETPIA